MYLYIVMSCVRKEQHTTNHHSANVSFMVPIPLLALIPKKYGTLPKTECLLFLHLAFDLNSQILFNYFVFINIDIEFVDLSSGGNELILTHQLSKLEMMTKNQIRILLDFKILPNILTSI